MERIPSSPPLIAPLPKETKRPLWSVMIPTYNCSIYLIETIESVLKQDMGAELMQIEVVDDCSTDADVCELVKTTGKGRVSYYKQEENVGSLRNFETCLNRSKGMYVHLLHGDDKIREGFYTTLTKAFNDFPDAGAVFTDIYFINEDGVILSPSRVGKKQTAIVEDALQKLSVAALFIQYASIAVQREVYERLGSFFGVTYGEDWEMWARIAKYYPIVHVPTVLAEYRRHDSSITSKSFLDGSNVSDIKKVIETICGYLPQENQRKFGKQAQKSYAYSAIQKSHESFSSKKNKKLAFAQIKAVLKFYVDTRIILSSIHLILRVEKENLKKVLRSLKKTYIVSS